MVTIPLNKDSKHYHIEGDISEYPRGHEGLLYLHMVAVAEGTAQEINSYLGC